MIRSGLPIDAALPQIADAARACRPLVITAEPGSGKSTVVPLALLEPGVLPPGKIVMLEPRRIAARAAARRMASMLNEPPGKTVGYRTRFETVVSEETRVEVVTGDHDDRTNNRVTVIVEERLALAVRVPGAFVKIAQ